MKFQVREGYVVRFFRRVDLGDGESQMQEVVAYAGQSLDLSAEEAQEHAHKLEPLDKGATALLEKKVLPSTPATTAGLTPEAFALVQETAKALAAQIVAGMQASAQPAAPAA
jgi:hypothetical protein